VPGWDMGNSVGGWRKRRRGYPHLAVTCKQSHTPAGDWLVAGL
jgi:hypothetical protein